MNAKRIFDAFCALLGLIVLSPLMLCIAVLIIISSKGPVLFRQRRIGLCGQPFDVLKFRTMVAAADCRGLGITVSNDPRITTIGHWLRRSKIDELPQLLNVLKGDMSLVGPRPEVPEYVDLYPSEAKRKIFSVRPGITDNAAIFFRNESDLLAAADNPETEYIENILPKKIAMYLDYVESQSFVGDIVLIWNTILCLVMNR